MPLPDGTTLVRVFGTYVDVEGKPREGFIIFKPSVVTTGGDTVVTGETRVKLDATGSFSIELPTSDNTGLDPDGWTYDITEMLYGGTYRKFSALLPNNVSEIEIADLQPADNSTLDPDLRTIAELDSTQSGVIASDGAGWIRKTYSALKTALSLSKSDVGLNLVDNTSDAGKPISNATATALSGKSDTGHSHALDSDLNTIAALDSAQSGVIASDGAGWLRKTYAQLKTALNLVKADVGLGNVDNTADVDKPISTDTLAALNAKLKFRGAWAPSTVYAVNDVVTFAGSEFVVTGAFTSGTSFALANLVLLTGPVYRVHVAWYGVKGDGKPIADANMALSSTTLTSATANFTNADVGKYIKVTGAGINGNANELVATINSVTNATTVVLSVAAAVAVTNVRAVYGTDDAAAIETAIGAAVTGAQTAGHGYAEVQFGAAIYMVSRAPLTGAPYYGNAQIRLPAIPEASQKVILSLKGGNVAGTFGHWLQGVPQRAGTVIYSTLIGGTLDGTWSAPSIIGGPTKSDQGGNFSAGFSNMLIHMDGITMMAPKDPSVTGLDFGHVAQMHLGSIAILADRTPNEMNNHTLVHDLGLGLRVPQFGNNHYVYVESLAVEGFYYGTTLSDHFTAGRLVFVYTNTAMFLLTGGASEHGISIANLGVEATDTILEAIISSGGRVPIQITQVNTEIIRSTAFKDTNNGLVGTIGFTANNNSAPTVAGCSNVRIIDLNSYPGNKTAPGIPSSTTPLKNPFFRDCAVTITGGTVTVIAVDGVATGLTAGTVIVPASKAITLTYSVAPTWVWTAM